MNLKLVLKQNVFRKLREKLFCEGLLMQFFKLSLIKRLRQFLK